MVHRLMPPQMVLQIVRGGPTVLQGVDPGDALPTPSRHFQHVRDAMGSPEVGGIAADRFAAGGLGFDVMAAFLVREAAAAEDRIESWDRTGPMVFHAQNRG